jgi:exodeoxyribonuclease VII large subunit
MVFVETNVSTPGAAQAITDTLRAMWSAGEVDVIIMARGGGDAVQLLPFSDEALCRTICDSPVPIVSAIGHEGDRPLCDEVADLRCGTPSLAAAAVVPDRAALIAELDGWRGRARTAAVLRAEHAGVQLAAIEPSRALTSGLAVASERLTRAAHRLPLVHPARQAPLAARRLTSIDHQGPLRVRLAAQRARLTAGRRHLDALDPTRVLARGYAIVRTGDGRVVRRAADTAQGDALDVQLAEGRLRTRVEQVEEGPRP